LYGVWHECKVNLRFGKNFVLISVFVRRLDIYQIHWFEKPFLGRARA